MCWASLLNGKRRDLSETTKESGLYRGASVFFEPTGHPLAAAAAGEPVGLAGPFVEVNGPATDIFKIARPMFAEDVKKGIFFHWFPPPLDDTKTSKGITINRFGNGQAIYVPANLFEEYYREPSEWVRGWMQSVVSTLAPEPPLSMDGGKPSAAYHETFWKDPNGNRAIVLIANTSARLYNSELVPVRGAKLIGFTAQMPVRAAEIVWPQRENLRIRQAGAHWEVDTSNLGVLTAIELSLGPTKKTATA